jgi:hypothetical protein
MMKPRRNDKRVIEAAAAAAHVPEDAFFVQVDHGIVFVNHPDSMKWPAETRHAIEAAVEQLTGMKASVT